MQLTLEWSKFFNSFEEDKIKENTPESPGIYLFWVKLTKGEWKCFFVGETSNLQKRILSHTKPTEKRICISDRIKDKNCGYEFAIVEENSHREGIMTYLYDYYKPECSPDRQWGYPIFVNLPE